MLTFLGRCQMSDLPLTCGKAIKSGLKEEDQGVAHTHRGRDRMRHIHEMGHLAATDTQQHRKAPRHGGRGQHGAAG